MSPVLLRNAKTFATRDERKHVAELGEDEALKRMESMLAGRSDALLNLETALAQADRLHDRLVDPALVNHPKRPAAALRHVALMAEVEHQAALVEVATDALVRWWMALSHQGREALRKDGWPDGDGAALRAWLEAGSTGTGKRKDDLPW